MIHSEFYEFMGPTDILKQEVDQIVAVDFKDGGLRSTTIKYQCK